MANVIDNDNFEEMYEESRKDPAKNQDPVFDPFKEEFDSENIINRDEEKTVYKKEDIEELKKKKVEVEDIITYSDDERKKNSFNELFQKHPNADIEDNLDRIRKSFKDFLNAPKISGKVPGFSSKKALPSNVIKNSGQKVTIIDKWQDKHNENDNSTVVMHKNPDGEILSIEIICSCGKKTLVEIDYSDDD